VFDKAAYERARVDVRKQGSVRRPTVYDTASASTADNQYDVATSGEAPLYATASPDNSALNVTDWGNSTHQYDAANTTAPKYATANGFMQDTYDNIGVSDPDPEYMTLGPDVSSAKTQATYHMASRNATPQYDVASPATPHEEPVYDMAAIDEDEVVGAEALYDVAFGFSSRPSSGQGLRVPSTSMARPLSAGSVPRPPSASRLAGSGSRRGSTQSFVDLSEPDFQEIGERLGQRRGSTHSTHLFHIDA
jgi:hypothetical protein